MTDTPLPKPATQTPEPPTATPAPEETIDEPEPEVVAEPPAEGPVAEDLMPEPTATPVPEPTATPVLPTATATSTVTPTSTPVVAAAVAEPPATPAPPVEPVEPTEPSGELVVAGDLATDPSPFVLLATLLFALAAAAGQVLRGDPMRARRLATGFDGLRRTVGGATGNGAASQAVRSAGAPPDASSTWPYGDDRLAGNGQVTHPGSMVTDGLTSYSQGHQSVSGIGGTSSGGLGGQAGGLNGGAEGLAKGLANGFDGLASGGPSGAEGRGFGGDIGASHDVAASSGVQVPDVQADGPASDSLRPTDRGIGDLALTEAAHSKLGGASGGSGGIGGGFGGDLARAVGGGHGFEAAQNGLGGSLGGETLGSGIDGSGDALAKGLGGQGGAGNELAHGATPPGEVVAATSTPVGQEGALQRAGGAEGELAERLDELARTLSSPDGPRVADVGLPPGSVTPDAGSGFGPSWLGAGALARAPRLDPLPRTYRCPACRKPLVYGHRFCGYCGEPLDKTLG